MIKILIWSFFFVFCCQPYLKGRKKKNELERRRWDRRNETESTGTKPLGRRNRLARPDIVGAVITPHRPRRRQLPSPVQPTATRTSPSRFNAHRLAQTSPFRSAPHPHRDRHHQPVADFMAPAFHAILSGNQTSIHSLFQNKNKMPTAVGEKKKINPIYSK